MEDSQIRDAQTEYDKFADGPVNPPTLLDRMNDLPASAIANDMADWLTAQQITLSNQRVESWATIWDCCRGYIEARSLGREDTAAWYAKRLAETCEAALEKALL